MVSFYLTISPLLVSRSSFVLHYAGGGFQEEASIEPVCACLMVCGAVTMFWELSMAQTSRAALIKKMFLFFVSFFKADSNI